MAPKPKSMNDGALSPKGKSAAKASPLGLAGASMLGGGSTPKAAAPAATEKSPRTSPSSPRGKDASATPSLLSAGRSSLNGGSSLPNLPKNENGSGAASAAAGAPTPAAAAPAPAAAKASAAAGKAPEATPAAASSLVTVSPEAVAKFHSAIRWAKPWAEVEEAASGVDLKTIGGAQDVKNGNTAVHIAAQNGHLDLVLRLLDAGAPISLQNFKGQTPLHMTVEYDFYFVSKLLVDRGADTELANEDGNKAINGIDGGKTGKEAWDNPVMILRAASTPEDLELSFAALEKALATPEVVSKEQLIQVGMAKKKAPNTQAFWDHKRFMTLAAKF